MQDTRVMSSRRKWAFPLAVMITFGLLVALGVSGSSVSLLAVRPPVTIGSTVTPDQDPALLLGKPRPIRSDEWAISTPLSVGQTADGFDPDPWIGLTPTDLSAVSYSAPQRALATLMKPETWGYLFLGPDRGLAWAWWFPIAAACISLYVLLLLLIGRAGVSVGLTLIGVLTPYAAWWTSPTPNLFIALAAAATAALLSAITVSRVANRVLLAILAGYFAAALVLTLYPPWAISTGLVMAALAIGVLVDSRPPLKGMAVTCGIAGVTAAAIGIWWLRGALDDLEAIANTIYPGQRISGPGEASLAQLFSAYANPYAAVTDAQPALGNQSEIAGAWIALPVVAFAIVSAIARRKDPVRKPNVGGLRLGGWSIAVLSGTFAILAAWALWPGFPRPISEVLLLSRVPGVRVPLALGLALLLLVAALGQRAQGWSAAPWMLVIAGSIPLATAALAIWAAGRLYPAMTDEWKLVAAVGALVVSGAFTAVIVDRGVAAAVPVAVVYAVVSVALVNPLYRGLGPLRSDPVARHALEISRSDSQSRAIVLGGRELNALVRGGGVQVLSGTTLYPNPNFWSTALPDESGLWNNYRNYEWSYDPEAKPIVGTVTAPDAALLQVDLCSPVIQDLDYDVVFTTDPIDAPCLSLERILQRPNGQTVRVYQPVSVTTASAR